jgi:hypothetical protein
MVDLDQESLLENGYDLIGYSFVPQTPFRPKDYEKMDDLDSHGPPEEPSYSGPTEEPDQLVVIDPTSI